MSSSSTSSTSSSGLGAPSVGFHSFYSLLLSLAFFTLSYIYFPKVLPSWLMGSAVSCDGSVGAGCVGHRAALASPHSGRPYSPQLPAPCHLYPIHKV